MLSKTKKTSEHKRHGRHHKQTDHYKQIYWPYLPLVGLAIVMLAFSILPTKGMGKTLSYATEMSHQSLLDATNNQRSKNGREKLTLHTDLIKAAQIKAEDMVKRNYWSHTTPEGQDPWIFIDQTGYSYSKAGENLAYGFVNSVSTVNGWMNSQTHKDNMLDNAFTDVGFGFANASDFQNSGEETIVVAMYGRPQSLGTATAAPSIPVESAREKEITKVAALGGSRLGWAPFAIGLIGGVSVTGLFINHGLRVRRLMKRGEKYFVAHPILDIALIIIVFACLELSRTVGFIQ